MVAACVVCAATANVYCQADKAFLCSGCDKTIHTANVLASRHCRVPVCELCKRSASTVYCHTDAASLCDVCNREVHESNPLPHNVVPIEQALDTLRAPAAAPAPAPAPATEDEVSACGEHCAASPAEPLLSSEINTSVAIVPEMPAPLEAAFASRDAPWATKDFDNLDLDGWMNGMDFDFQDILGADMADGLVPTFNPAPVVPAAKPAAPVFPGDDCVVPTLDLPDTFLEPVLPATGNVLKRAAPAMEAPQPPQKVAAVSVNFAKTAVPAVAPVPAVVRAPMPPPAVKPAAVVEMMPAYNPAAASAAAAAHQQAMLMNGANLTREQRVARYREKRKNRKFQKTIRYASRKAYAEVRPRIKGRFATREEVLALKAAAAAGQLSQDEDDCLVPTLEM
eukprot:CAMPEP_0202857206 /NCGR_PEP_ID=MMETSP1391-20130828/235_1 /ASSEMBLY_ACC=CAM_ASM_000867 /TAXON_ID=1034604 /ORGANISM="Chlamydomonas leiostraca, Strain SAG 11-49" /LENGTH=394 /DNA_ID=CAMNT_0049535985 /DNA_START=78 /DNA_END=1262 /DNA_ORIENTATION=-